MSRQAPESQLFEIVETIYDAAIKSDSWIPVIDQVGSLFNAHATGISLHDDSGRLQKLITPGVDPHYLAQYNDHYGDLNPWFQTPGMMKAGRVLTDETFHQEFGMNHNYFAETEFYQDWCRPQKFDHSMGSQLASIAGNSLNFSIFRTREFGAFTPKEIQHYRTISQHLLKAMEMAKTAHQCNQTAVSAKIALENAGIGYALIDRKLTLYDANRQFKTLLERIAGITASNRRITIANPQVASDIAAKMGLCLSTQLPQTTHYLVGHHKIELSFTAPTHAKSLLDPAGDQVTLTITTNISNGSESFDLRGERFRMNENEARLTEGLIRGKNLRDACNQWDIAYDTGRWHIRNAMKKAGARNQKELVYIITAYSVHKK